MAEAEEELRLRLPSDVAAGLRALAVRRGLLAEDLAAALVAGELAREAAPSPSSDDLAARQAAGGAGARELAAGTWRVEIAAAAAAEFDRFPSPLRAEVRRQAAALAADPTAGRQTGSRRRSGFRHAGGEWRLVYALDEGVQTVRVLLVTTRENAVY